MRSVTSSGCIYPKSLLLSNDCNWQRPLYLVLSVTSPAAKEEFLHRLIQSDVSRLRASISNINIINKRTRGAVWADSG